jgi:predicted extracellular nuclease
MAASDLFISEYVEGSSNNKAIEIYNGTGAAVDLGALGYSIAFYFNGSTTAGTTIALTGTLADGDVHVIADNDASTAILAVADQTPTNSFFNGDDAVALLKNGVIVDVIGQIGFDPGSEWGTGLASTQDNTLRRLPSILAGDTDGSDAFDPAAEWEGFALDTFDGLGSHTVDLPGIVINEMQVSTAGTDWEFVELFGTANASLDGYFLVGVESDGSAGTIDLVIDLTGQSLDANGFFLAASPTAEATYGVTADLAIPENSFENGSAAYFLVQGFTGATGDDLDANDDGVLDSLPWTDVSDSVSIVDSLADAQYGAAVLGPDGSFLPSGVFRTTDGGDWDAAFLNFSTPDGTPGASNAPVAVPGVAITESGGSTDVSEAGTTDSFDVVLTTRPTADVTVTLTPDAETTLDQTVLTFTPADWDVPQTVTVSAVADAVDEAPDLHVSTITVAVTSTDTDYDGLAVADLTVNVTDDQTDVTLISTIQGDGDASALVGQVVTVRAVVVGDFQNGDADESRNLGGFWLQEEDADADGNAATSEGIFVFDAAFGVDVNVGDIVTVTGTVDEVFGETQIDTVTSVSVESSGNALPTAVQIDLSALSGTTLSQSGDVQPDLEAFEGMLVTFTDTLVVTEMFQLDRFNEIKLFEGDRPQQFTQVNDPDAAGYQAALQQVGALTITYDDGLNVQNASIDNLDGFAPFNTGTAVSMGDSITGLTGILDYKWAGNSASGSTWRVRATEDGQNSFVDTNPADTDLPEIGGDLKVASFNVLNFFTTLDLTGNVTDTGADPRGADSQAEYDRQLEKLVTTLAAMDADVVGLVEIENTNDSRAVATLVDALNTAVGAGTYGFVDTGLVGTDAITNAFIYKTATVSLNGVHAVLDTPGFVDPLGALTTAGESFNRPAIAQTFTEIATGESFTAVVNHLKSKGSLTGAAADQDQGDGQGNNNATRDAAAQALADWLATGPTGDTSGRTIILGDLNSYAKEDPIQTLIAAGYDDLAQLLIGPDAYSYVFDGLTGTLDYAMTDRDWSSLVHTIVEWHVNADEADALDYNLDFGRDPAIFDGTSPLRNSDHDPVIVGLNLVADVQLLSRDGPFFVSDEYARFDRALADAFDGNKIKVLDGVAVGDLGMVTVEVEDLRISLPEEVSGTFALGDGIQALRLLGFADAAILGNAEANRLRGNAGDNVIEDGAGTDRMIGRGGSDTFVIAADGEKDVIVDFSSRQGDLIDLTAFGLTGFADIEGALDERAWGVRLDLGGGDVLRLRDLTAADLSDSDFLFALALA